MCLTRSDNPRSGRLATTNAADGPYDPGPMDGNCATRRRGPGGGGLPRTGPAQGGIGTAPSAATSSWWSASWNWLKQKASCTVDRADEASLATGLEHIIPGLNHGAGKLITDAIAGNSVTVWAKPLVHPTVADGAAFAAASLGYPDLALWGLAEGTHRVIMAGGEITTLTGTVSTVALNGAEYATGVGELNAAYDIGSTIVAGIGCAAGWWD